MKTFFTLALLAITLLGFTQDYNIGMQVSRNDLKLNYYSNDSTANAIVIYDYGNSFVDEKTYWLRVQVQQKIKILKSDGLNRGEFEIPLYKGGKSKEKIKDIKGTTYNLENGEIVKTALSPSSIFEEENENFTTVKIVLPNVKVGSVVTLSYETQSQYMANFQPWYFQGENPVLYSEYNTSIPGNYEYNIKLVGTIPLTTHDTSLKKNCVILRGDAGADCAVAKYVMKNIPAYKPEGYTTTSSNYISKIEYELSVVRGFDGSVDKLTKTWDSVDQELKTDSDFGKQLGKKSTTKNLLPETIANLDNNSLEKAKRIFEFVQNNYKWNGKSERYDVSVKNLLKENVGSVFEINILLENLLNYYDYEVFPVLISTRGNGLATKIYPVLTDFNYLILKTKIDGEDYFLDATDAYLPFGRLPFRCLNQYGRLMDFKDGSYWEDISVSDYSTRQHRVLLSSFSDNQFYGTIDSEFTGYHADGVKQRYIENPNTYKNKRKEANDDLIIDDLRIIDFQKNGNIFKEALDFNFEPEVIGNKIYLNPFIFKFFEENPFKLQERSYPIDFGYKDIYLYRMQINLPENMKVLEIPDSLNYALPDNTGTFTCSIELSENMLTIFFKVKFTLEIYPPEYYDALKLFMNKVVETQKNTILVLEKH